MKRSGSRRLAGMPLALWALVGGTVCGQSPTEDEVSPLVVLAWEAGCLSPGECSVLEVALSRNGGFHCSQQEVAEMLLPERRGAVMACLLALEAWRGCFAAVGHAKPAVAPGDFRARWDMNLSGQGEDQGAVGGGLRLDGRRAGPGPVGGAFRATPSRTGLGLEAAHAVWHAAGSKWWCGSIVGRFGQGLVMWTPSAFDDLGGMEGSHRIGHGLGPARYPQRGMWTGVGWEQQPRPLRGWRHWALAGRMWPDQATGFAMGGEGRNGGWALRGHGGLSGDVAWVAGWHGGATCKGWSWRWAWAGFERGWEGRISLLRSWSRRWEAHGTLLRTHPEHPRWMVGEVRASPPVAEDLPGGGVTVGIALRAALSGWARWGVDWEGSPPFRMSRRSHFRLEYRHHRMDFRTRWQSGALETGGQLAPPTSWALSWRKEGQAHWSGPVTWRLHAVGTGSAGALGAVLAVTLSWKSESGASLRWGVGQAWGDAGAPIRWVTGWDGRPAGAFSGEAFHGFFRWRSARGTLLAGVQLSLSEARLEPQSGRPAWAIHSVRVEFRPKRSTRHRR